MGPNMGPKRHQGYLPVRDAESQNKLSLITRQLSDNLGSFELIKSKNFIDIPTISVVMSVYNGGSYLGDSVASILKQTYKNFEVIIINDGSTDESLDILTEYLRKDNRIAIINQHNSGLSNSLNRGIELSRSDLIARMDADDISNPTRLEEQFNFMNNNPEVAVAGTAFELFGENTKRKIITMPVTNESIRRNLAFRFCLCHPTVMFRKKTIVDAGGYQGTGPCQDLELWLRLSRNKTLQFANLEKPLLKYRVHPNQIKGSIKAYIAAAGYIFKEAITQKSPRFFLGALISFFKILPIKLV
ncbi:MAG: glycosyltransferase [Desulfobacteraceae bacterium]|nr:glycosyltransferase [Desulfobacteraceae bacterium]